MTAHFGLDIGSVNLKFVQAVSEGSGYRLLKIFSSPTPPNILLSDAQKDIEILAGAVKAAFTDSGITTKNVVTAIPESQTITRVKEMPLLSESELASAIKFTAEEEIPLPLEDVHLTHTILKKPPKDADVAEQMEVLMVAVPKKVLEKHLKIVKLAGLNPLAIETEIIAVARALVGMIEYSPTTLIINIGAMSTDLAIVRDGGLAFTRSIATGGTALARAIANELGLELVQAEEYKKSYGLDETRLEGKVVAAIKPVFDVVVNEIKRAIVAYQAKHPDDSVKRVVLTGGTSKLPGIVFYLARSLGVEVQLADPFSVLVRDQSLEGAILEQGPLFAAAVGLALKNV